MTLEPIQFRNYQDRIHQKSVEYLIQPSEIKLKTLLIESPAGCHARGTLILRADGQQVPVEDIKVGDEVMGEAGPVQVTELHRGRQQMVRIIPTKGDSFVVNLDHILTLVRTNDGVKSKQGKKVDVSVRDWLTWTGDNKHNHKLFRQGVAHFSAAAKSNLEIDPYFLGVLLGDGSLQRGVNVTTVDPEIVAACYEQIDRHTLRIREDKPLGKTPQYYFAARIRKIGNNRGSNELVNKLQSLNLRVEGKDKFIPFIYKTASVEDRLALLAGLIDTDGSLGCNNYDIIQKSKQLAYDIAYVCRSVGLAAYVRQCQKECCNNGVVGTYYRVSISGDVNLIPVKIPRKQASVRQQKKSVLRTGISVELLEEDDFYGFAVTGNGRYLMGDFTVTHNSGKTIMALRLAKHFHATGHKIGWIAPRHELLKQAEIANNKWFGIPIQFISLFDRQPEKYQGCTFITTDEAAHDACRSAAMLHEAIRPEVILGLSATPYRTDHAKLCFAKVIRDAGIHQLIREGYLAKFNQWMLEDMWSPEVVAKTYLSDKERWGPSVAYFPKLDEAGRCADILIQAGVRAACITGAMRLSDRERALKMFADGELDILTNVMVLTEGYDEPRLQTAFVRPSVKGPTVQMAGRVFRLHSNKPIVNVVQNKDTHYAFNRHATPEAQFMQRQGAWDKMGLKDLHDIFEQQRTKMIHAKVEMPKFIEMAQKRELRPRRFQRNDGVAGLNPLAEPEGPLEPFAQEPVNIELLPDDTNADDNPEAS